MFVCIKQDENIAILSGKSFKFLEQFPSSSTAKYASGYHRQLRTVFRVNGNLITQINSRGISSKWCLCQYHCLVTSAGIKQNAYRNIFTEPPTDAICCIYQILEADLIKSNCLATYSQLPNNPSKDEDLPWTYTHELNGVCCSAYIYIYIYIYKSSLQTLDAFSRTD